MPWSDRWVEARRWLTVASVRRVKACLGRQMTTEQRVRARSFAARLRYYLASPIRWCREHSLEPRFPFLRRRFCLLVRVLGGRGDVVMTTPVVRELKRRFPHCHLTYLTICECVDLLKGNSDIDELLTEAAPIARRRFDREIILRHDHDRRRHVVDVYARCAGVEVQDRRYSVPLSPHNHRYAESVFRRHGLKEGDLVLAMHVGAGWETRRWPYFQAVADYFVRMLQARVIQLGTAGEPALAGAINLLGRCTLKETAAILQRCTAALCNDSFILHLAGAVSTPVVGVFGPTLPEYFLPPSSICVGVNRADLPCIGCHRDYPTEHRYIECRYERTYCMQDLPPERVIEALDELLRRVGPGRVALSECATRSAPEVPDARVAGGGAPGGAIPGG
jgi:ADP-heptose:LPS heptosyltransferase